jgi:hypothetical protein
VLLLSSRTQAVKALWEPHKKTFFPPDQENKTDILYQSTLSTLNMYSASFSNILKQGQLPEDYKPSVTDILCGRGRACLEHSGNKIFSEVVRANAQKYIEAPKRVDKGIVVSSVVDSIKASGIRFIKQDKHSKLYYELSHDQAHEKTGHAIRDLLKTDTPPAGRKIAKTILTVDTESSRKRRSKAFARLSRDYISKFVPQELSSQAEIMPSMIISAAIEISDVVRSVESDYFTSDLLISENLNTFEHLFDDDSDIKPVNAHLGEAVKNEQEQGSYVIASPFLAPLPLSSETRIERADIRRLFEILSEGHSGP